jgi:hypothetical protein
VSAKFARKLIQRIYQHVAEEGWLAPGHTVLDPFCGTGLGAYDCIRAGYRFIGVELERHFHDTGAGCDCTGISKTDWVQYYGRWQTMRYADGRHWCPRCMAQVAQVTDDRKLSNRTFRTRRGVWQQTYWGRTQQDPTWHAVPLTTRKVKTKTVHFAPLCFPDRRDGVKPPRVSREVDMFGATTASYQRGSGQIPHTAPHHYEGNIEKWAREGHGGAVLLQGDSRELTKVLQAYGVSCAVASPPYANGCAHAGGTDPKPEQIHGGKAYYVTYGEAQGQLGNLPPGSVDAVVEGPMDSPSPEPPEVTQAVEDAYRLLAPGSVEAVITSMPFADSCVNDNQRTLARDGLKQGHNEGDGATYGASPANLANLPSGTVAAVVSSSPYETSWHDPGNAGWLERCRKAGVPEEQIARYGNGRGMNLNGQAYSVTPDNLGNTQGQTFWEAARIIVEQTYAVLPPGGHAVWVCKGYIRDGQLVDFPGDWRRLCEACGFVTLHEHHALLTEDYGTQGGLMGLKEDAAITVKRISFFRRLAEKRPGVPTIDFETVHCMVKPGPGDERGIAAIVASPPYNPPMSQDHNGTRGGQRGHTPSETGAFARYGNTPGQLEGLRPGTVDAAISSSPFAGANEVLSAVNGIDWTKSAHPTGQRLTPGRQMYPYGTTPGQLGAMQAGTPPREETP